MKFEHIAGYGNIKKELSTIIGWYQEKHADRTLRLPRGVLLEGAPGHGKTLFLRAVKEEAPLPVFVYSEKPNEEPQDALKALFEEAAKERDGAIILLDELDHLLDQGSRVKRCLMEQMDGLTDTGGVLVLAAANDAPHMYDPLMRPGRFDRKIDVDGPCEADREKILRFYLSGHAYSLNEDEFSRLLRLTAACSCAEITALVEDARLRAGEAPLTFERLENSFQIVVAHELPEEKTEPAETPDFMTCVHEAAHAVVIDSFRKDLELQHVSVLRKDLREGLCLCVPRDDSDRSQNRVLQKIDISLAGYLAVKLFLKVNDVGVSSDLGRAKAEAVFLVGSLGYCGVDKTRQKERGSNKGDSWPTCFAGERRAARILRRRVRVVKRFLKANRQTVLALAERLQKDHVLTGRQVREIIGGTQACEAVRPAARAGRKEAIPV